MGSFQSLSRILHKNQIKQFKQSFLEDSIPSILIKTNSTFQLVNSEAIKLFGAKSKKEFLKKTTWALISDSQPHLSLDKKAIINSILLKAQEEAGNTKFDIQCEKLNGKNFWANIDLELLGMSSDHMAYVKIKVINEPSYSKHKVEQKEDQSTEEQIESLKLQVKKLKFEINTMKSQDLSGSLQMKLSGAEQRLKDKLDENKQLTSQFEQMIGEMKHMSKEEKEITSEIDEKQKEYENLQKVHDDLKSEIKEMQLQSLNNRMYRKLDEYQHMIDKKKDEFYIVSQQYEMAKKFLSKYEKLVEVPEFAQDEIDILKAKIPKLRAKVKEEQEKSMFKKVNSNENQVPVEKRIATLRNQLKVKVIENKQLRNQLDQFKNSDSGEEQITISNDLVSFEELMSGTEERDALSDSEMIEYSDNLNLMISQMEENAIIDQSKNFELFEKMLMDPAALQIFKEVLCENLQQEPLLFYIENEKMLQIQDPEEMRKMAEIINNKFIKQESLFELSLQKKIRDDIAFQLEQENFSAEFFLQIQEETRRVLFEYFVHMINSSPHFKNFILNPDQVPKIKKITKAILISRPKDEKILNLAIKFHGNCRNPTLLADGLIKTVIDLFSYYYSTSTRKIDFDSISQSVIFGRFVNLTTELQKANLDLLVEDERKCFFINIYNVLLAHSGILNGVPKDKGTFGRFMNESKYDIGGMMFSLADIKDGILRNNRTKPVKGKMSEYFVKEDRRSKYCITKIDSRMHFALSSFSLRAVPFRVFHAERLDQELSNAARVYLEATVKIIQKARKIIVPHLFYEYSRDFGNHSKEIVEWILGFVSTSPFLDSLANYELKFLPQFSSESFVIFDSSSPYTRDDN